jgi:peptidoglycan/xylan/chitin deacetylase (PgdA/CDA1 family)
LLYKEHVHAGRGSTWARAALRRLAKSRSVVLAYHGVGHSSEHNDPEALRVAPDRFRLQLELLGEAGFSFVSVAELVRRGRGGTPPAGLAAVSFDDGMEDNLSVALPLLQAVRVPATIYVTTGLIGRPNPWLSPTLGARMLTRDELRDLVRRGADLGAHSVSHRDLSKLAFVECLKEMTESKRTLENLTGAEVATFAYPYCRYGPAAREAAKAAAFEAAVTCSGRGSWDPYELKRAMISGRDDLLRFVLKVAELFEPLRSSGIGRVGREITRPLRRRSAGSQPTPITPETEGRGSRNRPSPPTRGT